MFSKLFFQKNEKVDEIDEYIFKKHKISASIVKNLPR